MSNLDPRIEAVRAQYGLSSSDFWQIHQNKQWVCKHAALEVVATKANVEWQAPQIIEADTTNGIAVLSVSGKLGERLEWATGEASPKNNKNSYPWAMAEKRAKDRVVLKLVGIHGLVYSEDEMPNVSPTAAPPPNDGSYEPPPRKANGLPEVGWREDGSRTSFWLKTSGTAEELRTQLHEDAVDCHTLKQLEELKVFYRGKARELKFNKAFLSVLTEEFGSIERSIMEAMEAAELAEVPLKDALQHSLPRNNLLAG